LEVTRIDFPSQPYFLTDGSPCLVHKLSNRDNLNDMRCFRLKLAAHN
jgi:hypothetical protein